MSKLVLTIIKPKTKEQLEKHLQSTKLRQGYHDCHATCLLYLNYSFVLGLGDLAKNKILDFFHEKSDFNSIFAQRYEKIGNVSF